jgi:hypothetical protein
MRSAFLAYIRFLALAGLLVGGPLLQPPMLPAEPIAVRNREGTIHGFLLLSTLEGDTLAVGDLIQICHGNRVVSRLVFHFKDGSLDDETAVFSQIRTFRLISDHHVQKGPAFPHPIDMSIDVLRNQVKVRYTEGGKEKVETDHLALPPDLANGIISILMQNIPPGVAETKLSFIAATPKARLVKLSVEPQGDDTFLIGGVHREATHYVVKVELGGIAGVVAPLVGKEPQNTDVWILGGDAPTFLKSEGPLSDGGSSLRMELTSPVWPRTQHSGR